ncbi:cystinosin homolog [Armigeres subalbatus]|uniref:cystinosin homolog n=1 Tax=Armigeres subalbatus TaxID=124917 RepID=UPI002ED37EE6
MVQNSALILLVVIAVSVASGTSANSTLQVKFVPRDYVITLDKAIDLCVWIEGTANTNASIRITAVNDVDHVNITPSLFSINGDVNYNNTPFIVSAVGHHQGNFIVKAVIKPEGVVDDRRIYAWLKVALSEPLVYVSLAIGWVYTLCWSSGYYPQILLNYQRKSVVGLSMDFLHINIVGHVCYAIFNSLMIWNSYIEQEYANRHPLGLDPVIGNDVGFSVHASCATGITILQCYIYERNGNTVSLAAKGVIGFYLSAILLSACMAASGVIHWLDFLYVLSWIKLSTSFVKYIPQAYMNYKRQSTEGFSIVNRISDIAGGLFGVLQMIINAWNFDDWHSITGNAVKFALGVISIPFDSLFIFQHYVLYRLIVI